MFTKAVGRPHPPRKRRTKDSAEKRKEEMQRIKGKQKGKRDVERKGQGERRRYVWEIMMKVVMEKRKCQGREYQVSRDRV